MVRTGRNAKAKREARWGGSGFVSRALFASKGREAGQEAVNSLFSQPITYAYTDSTDENIFISQSGMGGCRLRTFGKQI